MQVGNTIRKYRKERNLTQEEMASRLGVSAPAVSKWENGNSLPDISLLSPIARLLDISIDLLLSHEKELSNREVNQLLEELDKKLKTEALDQVFHWMKGYLEKYPNCFILILWMAQVFDSKRQMIGLSDGEKYDDYILNCYKRVLESDDERIKTNAAESLYYFYMNKNEYEQAEQYLSHLSQENPERKRKQAMIYSKTGRQEEAYKAYEELLYAGYQSLNMTFNNIYLLSLEEKDYDKAHMLVEKIQKLANLFEFGEYHELSSALELATLEKNENQIIYIMEGMLNNLESIYDFMKSPLYSHMRFKAVNEKYLEELRQELRQGFRDEETYGYLKENQKWRDLVGLSDK